MLRQCMDCKMRSAFDAVNEQVENTLAQKLLVRGYFNFVHRTNVLSEGFTAKHLFRLQNAVFVIL